MMIALTELDLCFPQLPATLDGLRILQVSDLHTTGLRRPEKILHRIMKQGADLMCFVGDFCFHLMLGNIFSPSTRPYRIGFSRQGFIFPPRCDRALRVLHHLLDGVSFPLGIYTVLGNHDTLDLPDRLAHLGIHSLNNDSRSIDTPAGGRFNLCGVRCFSRNSSDLPAALIKVNPDLFTIALCHFPELAEPLAHAGLDLILAGHTHGGQICRPNGEPLTPHSQTGRKYASGLERLHRSYIYTTRGLGHSVIPLRTYCPPEIVRITLRRGHSHAASLRLRKL